ncbi:MAG: PqqD family protein [Clostridia bacterium]|nr:PqqD family protein [Clostridia bacterium]
MKIKSGFVLEKDGGEYLAVAVGERAVDFEGMVRLNGTGAFFWNLMADKDITKDELVEAVLSNFVDVSREQVSGDVDNFVKTLSDGGILE